MWLPVYTISERIWQTTPADSLNEHIHKHKLRNEHVTRVEQLTFTVVSLRRGTLQLPNSKMSHKAP